MPRSTRRLSLESLGDRIVPAVGVRSIDGSGNNTAHTDWGKAGTDFIRKAPAAYADGVASPAGASRPSARAISNAVSDQGDADIISDRQLSAMIYAWGQFIDHDMDLTASGTGSFNIPVPTGDPSFDPNNTGTQVIPLTRSGYDANTGTSTPRQQINNITAWLDGSMVYGSDATTAASLREFTGGRLKTSDGELLPIDSSGFFRAGDTRANENPELTSMQTLFVREHNRIADKIHHANPRLNDEQLYQRARAIVGGEIQAITYKEWLPNLLGPNALPAYRGYKTNVNASIANEFATASFRFGHSLLGNDIEFLGNDGLPVADEMPLADAFFNPSVVKDNGIDPVLKYLASDPSSEVDTKVVDGVRNFLFGPPGAGGLDLASLNIQRGRDHGLADYNTVRAFYGLPKIHNFGDITHDSALGQKLHDLYGSVDNVDLWVGGLAEDHVPGASVGPTLKAVMTDQFVRLRDGDRFWYQRSLSAVDRQMVDHTTLSDLIRRNTDLTTIQPNAFVFRPEVTGRVFADPNHNGRPDPGEPGLAGRLVELVDIGTGDVIASKMTRQDGSYHFGVEDGLRTGQYVIRLAPPPNAPPPPPDAPPPPVVSIKASEMFKIDLPDPGPPH
ncbi:MAG TPA: peroxidase family protein [Gemmataceae bacterium]|nr:peroxidase family protein [Gemmataceae bacterium]